MAAIIAALIKTMETEEEEEYEYAWNDLQKTSGVRDLSIERYYKVYEDCEVKLERYERVDEDENDETRRRYCDEPRTG